MIEEQWDILSLPLDEQFAILLHKKIMNKVGANMRQAKKYYIDQYKKTGEIPKPLLLAAKGVMEGRKCSGRRRVLSDKVKKRFKEMVKASTDVDDHHFIFVSQQARTVANFHIWLEEEFDRKISLPALRRFAGAKHLELYLKKPDCEDGKIEETYFNPEQIFDLVQIDGCVFQYLKIKDEYGKWRKPQVIEFFDTGSRYIFVMSLYFSESSANAVDMYTEFLLSTPFPDKKIRLRPDQARGFLNLKRPIHELNLKYSIMPDRFYMEPDFSRTGAPKQKVHLESSHRTLHNFEVRVIKQFENRISKIEPVFTFKGQKKRKIMVTHLDIGMDELRDSGMIDIYQREHNEKSHNFSEAGVTEKWVPQQKMSHFLSDAKKIEIDPNHIKEFSKYGFDKTKASVSKERTIIYNKRKYYVAEGREKFGGHRSTTVHVSEYKSRLFIFEYKGDGVLLGEALFQRPSEKPEFVEKRSEKRIRANEIEQIAAFCESLGMTVNIKDLAVRRGKGLTLLEAIETYDKNKLRYDIYVDKLRESPEKLGLALFNAFLMDWDRCKRQDRVAPYAVSGGG